MATAKVNRWSQRVTRESNALDLEAGVFTLDDPRRIARSLMRSAEQSDRRKAEPFRSAMSMLTFYINRAGRSMPARQKKKLEAAKDALRELCQRPRRARKSGANATRRKRREASAMARKSVTARKGQSTSATARKRGAASGAARKHAANRARKRSSAADARKR